jgi:hypothetical protein
MTLSLPMGETTPSVANLDAKASAAGAGDFPLRASAESDKCERAYCSHVSHAQAVMTEAFIRWHLTGCFTAAADYTNARRSWEVAMLDSLKANERRVS